jgi:hypothetical protein
MTHGSDFDIPKRYEKIKDIGKDNLSEYNPQKEEKYNVFAPSRFKVPCVIAPTFSNTKYAKKMNALEMNQLIIHGRDTRTMTLPALRNMKKRLTKTTMKIIPTRIPSTEHPIMSLYIKITYKSHPYCVN